MDLGFVNLLLAFGALVALPSVPDIINRTIGRLGVAGQLIGQELSGSYGAGQRYAGQFQQGIGGFAGQTGNFKDKPGYYGAVGNDDKLRWEQSWQPVHGAQMGTWNRLKAGAGSLFGRNKPPAG